MFKEGIGEDLANKERIAKLIRFASTHSDTRRRRTSRSPTTYRRMKEGQDKIYYITADTFAAAKNSPHLEIFRKKGVEVLLLYDRVDEWVASNAAASSKASRCSRSPRATSIWASWKTTAEKQEQEKEAGEFKDLTDKIHKALGDKVKEVRVTHRLTGSPACLVSDQ